MTRDAEEDLSHVIPLTLDNPDKFLLWDKDVAGIFLVGMAGGITADWPITGVVLGVACALGYKRLKSGKHPGLSTHLLYWVAGAVSLVAGAKSHVREYNG